MRKKIRFFLLLGFIFISTFLISCSNSHQNKKVQNGMNEDNGNISINHAQTTEENESDVDNVTNDLVDSIDKLLLDENDTLEIGDLI